MVRPTVRLASVTRKAFLVLLFFSLSSIFLLSRPTCDDVILASMEYKSQMTSGVSNSRHGYNDRLVTAVDCRALIEGVDGGRELEKAQKYMGVHSYRTISDSELRRHVTAGCDVVRRLVTSQREGETGGEREEREGTEEERDFPLAYTILIHQDGAQVLRLLRQIYSPYNYYCVHVDEKASNDLAQSISAVAECLPNVYLPRARETVIYGHYTRLKAELNCMKRLLEESVEKENSIMSESSSSSSSSSSNSSSSSSSSSSNSSSSSSIGSSSSSSINNNRYNLIDKNRTKSVNSGSESGINDSSISSVNSSNSSASDSIPTNKKRWKYLINLTGQMFPLKTNLEIIRILSIFNGSNDIEGLSRWHLDGLRNRVDAKWTVARGKMKKTKEPNPPPPHKINLVKGSAYGAFSYDLIEFIFRDKIVQDFLAWSENVFSPDEIFWGTVNSRWVNPMFRTPGGYDAAPERKPWLASHSNWKGQADCSGKFVRSACVFGVGDLSRLVSRRELFANKFYEGFQYLTVDCLEEWLRNKTRRDLPIDLEYYRNIKSMLDYKN